MLDVILPPTCGSVIICYALICLHVLVLLMLLIWMMGKELLLDLSVDQPALFVKPTPVFHLLDQLSAEALQFGDSRRLELSQRASLRDPTSCSLDVLATRPLAIWTSRRVDCQ